MDAHLIERHGAVSHETAKAMAEAARRQLKVDIGVAVTGVAGPDSLEGKPPGLAYIAIADEAQTQSIEGRYPPRRADVKRLVVTHTLYQLIQRLLALPPSH